MTTETIQTFIACEIDVPLQQAGSAIIANLKSQATAEKVNWVPEKNFHITLRFLGPTATTQVELLKETIATVINSVSAFELPVGKLMLFPPGNYPHTVIINFALTQALAELVRSLEQVLISHGFKAEKRPYVPHLSLGRMQHKTDISLLGIKAALPAKVMVKEVVLFQSEQAENGMVYTPLWRLPLQH